MTMGIYVCISKWYHRCTFLPWTSSLWIGIEGGEEEGREEDREDIKLKQTTEDTVSMIISAFTYFILISNWISRDTNWNIDSQWFWPKPHPIFSLNPYVILTK